MRFTLASTLAMAASVSGHALMYGVSVNGKDQGDGRKVYIRTPEDNSPVKDLSSPNMACGTSGAKKVPSFVKAAAGDTLTFEWYHNTRDDDIIDGSHLGPVITYIAEYTDGAATGPIWSKIAEDGYDGSKWAVDKLKANHGKNDFALPSGLAAGQYLIRQEIIAHHESESTFDQNPSRGAQFYPSCVQVEVSGSGSTVPDQKFDFNVGYTYSDPGIHFNLYNGYSSYTIPGPKVFSGSGSSGGNTPKPATSAVASTPAAVPTPAPTQPAGGNGNTPASSTVVPAVTPTTLATVVNTVPAVPATTRASTKPSATPPTSCSGRRRRRRRSTKKHAKKQAI